MTEEQRLFVADAKEIVERLYRDLEQLRTARAEGRRRRELAAQIFRRMHTLKGSGGSLGFIPVSQIAHEFEGVLDGARLGRVELTDNVLDAFEDALDAIARGLQSPPSEEANPGFASIIQRLNQLAAKSKTQGVIAGKLRASLPPDIARSLSEYDLQHAREAVREGAKLFIVSAAFDIETFDRGFRELTRLLGESGEVIATVPGEPATADEINFRLLYAAELVTSETLRKASSLGRIECSEIKIARSAAEAKTTVDATETKPHRAPEALDGSVRVELKRLDDLISTAGELHRQTANALVTLGGPPKKETVEAAAKNLRGRFVDLEERLIKLRLVPVGEVLERAASRAGRIAARQMGREVEFEISGGDVGIEKSVADVIADPLLHLVRNAITHGIEDPEERKAAGKKPTGQVRLAASNHSGRIHITVTDDGRGIDIERIVAAAEDQGISGANLSMDQCLRLIFRPGFSTSSELSELSGRGIGLDVVDRAMDIAGGEVRVATEGGVGTTFVMIVPAALSMIRCLLVRSAGQVYAIDAACLDQSKVRTNDELPLLRLGSLLGHDNGETTAEGAEVVWKAPSYSTTTINGAHSYRIAFDGIVGIQERLVRSLGRHAPRWPGLCGATELLDGTVALVLDLEELIRSAQDEPSGV
jgi:two-component system, chemotaxis family, sensor kinase CheA